MILCYRCEHRARYLEGGIKPRYECGLEAGVSVCYMYEPVAPLALKAVEGENRPIGTSWMISGRAQGEEIHSVTHCAKTKNGLVMWKVPDHNKPQERIDLTYP